MSLLVSTQWRAGFSLAFPLHVSWFLAASSNVFAFIFFFFLFALVVKTITSTDNPEK